MTEVEERPVAIEEEEFGRDGLPNPANLATVLIWHYPDLARSLVRAYRTHEGCYRTFAEIKDLRRAGLVDATGYLGAYGMRVRAALLDKRDRR